MRGRSDLREGKRTLVLYRALANATAADREELLSVVGRSDASATHIQQALRLIRGTNAIEQISQVANEYVAEALELLGWVPRSHYRDLLEQFAGFVLARSH